MSEKSLTDTKQQKWWESPILASLATAIITAFLSIGGSYLTQLSAKSREASLARFEAERVRKREAITDIYKLIAKTISAADDRLAIAQGLYDGFSNQALDSIAKNTNDAEEKWYADREIAELNIYLYYGDKEEITRSWIETRKAIQQFWDCSQETYLKSQGAKAATNSCQTKKDGAYTELSNLRLKLANNYLAESRF